MRVPAFSYSGGFSGLFALFAVTCRLRTLALRAVELFECVFFGWWLLRLVEAPKSLASRAFDISSFDFRR
jgi:hypothetical protein